MTPDRRFLVHPGKVVSRNDGDDHYVGAARLARLYHLPPGSWVSADNPGFGPAAPEDWIHLYPRADGCYFDATETDPDRCRQRHDH